MAMFFGCSLHQEETIIKRLRSAGDAVLHPLLLVGILCELERDRLVGRVRPVADNFVLKTEILSTATYSKALLNSEGERPGDLLGLRFECGHLMNGLKASKAQILRICEHLNELDNPSRRGCQEESCSSLSGPGRRNIIRTGFRIKDRLLQIVAEYDTNINKCQILMDDLTATIQMLSNHIARHDNWINTGIALASKRDNSNMKSIGLVTMVYLPITGMASIFSMSVFNWSAPKGESVVTEYFWYYLAITGGLLVLTVGLWVMLNYQDKKRERGDIEKTE